MIRVEVLQGAALDAALDDLAALRIAVFRDWPYLYDGTAEYECDYLATYRTAQGAVVVGAYDNARLIGAATGTLMSEHADEFADALTGLDVEADAVFYCAESVLLPGYRGQGLGHRFFDLREARARGLSCTHAAFCAVIRGADHPLRPENPRDLAPFWRGRGYAPIPGAVARFGWRDLGQAADTEKDLQLWMRAL